MVMVLAAPAGAAGRTAGGGAEGLGGGGGTTAGLAAAGGAETAGFAVATPRGLARICFTWSMSLVESNGLGMCPLAPTAMAFEGSIGDPPPRSSTGTSFRPASARTFWHSS
jgi:hypothetical protein